MSDVSYTQKTWVSGETPLSADNMNNIEQGVADCAEAVNAANAEIAGLNSNKANVSSLTDGSVTKVGTSTVGSSTKPIYLSSGTPTASSSTVGSTTNPIYLNSGTLTACTAMGTIYKNSVTISTGTGGADSYTAAGTITVPAGTYVLVATGQFASNSSESVRRVQIYNSTTSSGIKTASLNPVFGYIAFDCTDIRSFTTSTTLACRLSTSLSTAISGCVGDMCAVRIV